MKNMTIGGSIKDLEVLINIYGKDAKVIDVLNDFEKTKINILNTIRTVENEVYLCNECI